jgi:hypothetical protein
MALRVVARRLGLLASIMPLSKAPIGLYRNCILKLGQNQTHFRIFGKYVDKMSVVPCNLVLSRTLVRIPEEREPNEYSNSPDSPNEPKAQSPPSQDPICPKRSCDHDRRSDLQPKRRSRGPRIYPNQRLQLHFCDARGEPLAFSRNSRPGSKPAGLGGRDYFAEQLAKCRPYCRGQARASLIVLA